MLLMTVMLLLTPYMALLALLLLNSAVALLLPSASITMTLKLERSNATFLDLTAMLHYLLTQLVFLVLIGLVERLLFLLSVVFRVVLAVLLLWAKQTPLLLLLR